MRSSAEVQSDPLAMWVVTICGITSSLLSWWSLMQIDEGGFLGGTIAAALAGLFTTTSIRYARSSKRFVGLAIALALPLITLLITVVVIFA